MPNGRITKRSVDALLCPPDKDRTFLWDDVLAGFGVGVYPTGKKVYVVQYRQNGRSRRTRLGDHGRLTPDQARSMAIKCLGQVEGGADPVQDRRAARNVPSFREVAEDFLRLHVKPKRKERTFKEYERILSASTFAMIGSRRIVDVQRSDVAKLHSEMADAPYQANRAVALISAIWNWAARRDIVSAHENPASRIDRFPEVQRDRYLSAAELARLGASLLAAEARQAQQNSSLGGPKRLFTESVDPYAIAAIRLLIFTGARLQEILKAKWTYLDTDRGILNLPDSKTGRKTIYLGGAALLILGEIPRCSGNEYIIAGSRAGAPRSDLKRPWSAITRAAGLSGLRIHDLRHSFASIGAGASLGLPIVGKLLGHTQAATTQRYAHLDLDPMRRAAELVNARISVAMAGK